MKPQNCELKDQNIIREFIEDRASNGAADRWLNLAWSNLGSWRRAFGSVDRSSGPQLLSSQPTVELHARSNSQGRGLIDA